ncbi:protein UmuC (plasmid) [Methylobacterium phyllosphaerae]|uniref:DNA-directed DNA polymerase n=1 Tax=Methylobacterium phyllosphaerae TaxID=418223 RepID=A0AAE8HY37_9HYPH|nr:Y-family DNA polymerase [Methylobacterium phyllosphaerae]APT35043.1 protein UmuC [Methylobacterium phyllosphaerae]SFH71020.1 DNA polymerase V [Methylobacterium phyllosphaerae]
MERTYALSDGNSFYCSCERVFDPKLARVPVIVLSNNDGCAIARTAEAKAVGIKMGDPWFKIRQLCRDQGVRVYSSNYALYGDMSARVNEVYRRFSPRIEVYSIDESFLDLSDVRPAERFELASDLRGTVHRWTGVPTCVGIGSTKTLAKLANHIAKTHPDLGGVCDLTDPQVYDHWVVRIPPGEIWGVGASTLRKLEALGCDSVADVRDLDPRAARKLLTVVGERLVYELRGIPCLDLETVAPTRKGCAVTRSFSERVEDLATMEQALAAHAARLGEKLRREGLGTDHLTVFFHTSEHDRDRPQRSISTVVTLPEASSDTLVLAKAATFGVRKVWRDGYRYSKAGIVTTDLMPLESSQRALIGGLDREIGGRLMEALDACNRRFGRGAVVPASAGWTKDRTWSTKFELRSPRYTTRIDELPVVMAA